MEFIPRPNLPEGLASALVQIMAKLNDPLARGIESAGSSIGNAIGNIGAEERARNQKFQDMVAALGVEGRLENIQGPAAMPPDFMGPPAKLPTKSGYTTEDLRTQLGLSGAYPGQPMRIKPRKEPNTVTVDEKMVKTFPDLAGILGNQITTDKYLDLIKNKDRAAYWKTRFAGIKDDKDMDLARKIVEGTVEAATMDTDTKNEMIFTVFDNIKSKRRGEEVSFPPKAKEKAKKSLFDKIGAAFNSMFAKDAEGGKPGASELPGLKIKKR